MGFIEEIKNCIPSSPMDEIPWKRIEQLLAASCFADMKTTQQNPVFHGEGDVYTHTQMVCRELLRTTAFHEMPDQQKTELFLAAILHDIGKVKTTRLEDGIWVSPHHSLAGSQIVREFLWQRCGVCGTQEMIRFRETVCALIRYHMLPVYLLEQEEPERTAREIAAVGELAADFSWHLLCILAEADVRGRTAVDVTDGLAQVELSRLMAEEAMCLYAPYSFADSFTKRAYLAGRNVQPDQRLYDDTWGEVLLLSGLPGTGKDTWIRQNAPELPMISLDDIRREFGAAASGEQAKVIHTAQERARMLLRSKQSFVWNATNITPEIRAEQVGLFERYGARVRVVYLETPWETELARNEGRREKVPQAAIENLLAKTVPPMPDEAQTVEWYCV